VLIRKIAIVSVAANFLCKFSFSPLICYAQSIRIQFRQCPTTIYKADS